MHNQWNFWNDRAMCFQLKKKKKREFLLQSRNRRKKKIQWYTRKNVFCVMYFQAYNEFVVVRFHRLHIVNFHGEKWLLIDDVEPQLILCLYRQKFFVSLSSLWEHTGIREKAKTKNFKLLFRISATQKSWKCVMCFFIQISPKYYLDFAAMSTHSKTSGRALNLIHWKESL